MPSEQQLEKHLTLTRRKVWLEQVGPGHTDEVIVVALDRNLPHCPLTTAALVPEASGSSA